MRKSDTGGWLQEQPALLKQQAADNLALRRRPGRFTMPGMHMPAASTRLPAVGVALLLTAAVAAAQSNLPVYDDSLHNGFEDRLWTSLNLACDSPVHSGTHSIRVEPMGPWQGLFLHHPGLDTVPYASVSFWINGGELGGQRLQVQALLGDSNPPANVYYRFTVQTDGWQQITVPLAILGGENQSNLTGLWIQLTPNGASNAFYVDDIQFNLKPTEATMPPGGVPASNSAKVSVADAYSAAAIWCIAGALVLVTAMLGWLIFLMRRHGLGSPQPAAALSAPVWRQLAPGSLHPPESAAEVVAPDGSMAADPRVLALRERVAAELAEFAKQSLVQGLYSQRGELLENQRKAQAELARLEERLAALHLPLQERIRAYETRIQELEKELDTRGEEMRNLIETTLLLVRGRLEEEKASEPELGRLN